MGDATRPVEGTTSMGASGGLTNIAVAEATSGAFVLTSPGTNVIQHVAALDPSRVLSHFASGNVVTTGNVNIPRSWGALACVYLGQPATV